MTTSPDDNQGSSPRGFSPFKAREKRIVAENAAFRSRDPASSACFPASTRVKEEKRETNYGRLVLLSSFLSLGTTKKISAGATVLLHVRPFSHPEALQIDLEHAGVEQ